MELVAQQHAPLLLQRCRLGAAGQRAERAAASRRRSGRARPGGAAHLVRPWVVSVARCSSRYISPDQTGSVSAAAADSARSKNSSTRPKRWAGSAGKSSSARDALDHLLGRPAAAVAVADREQALRVRVSPAAARVQVSSAARGPTTAVVAAVRVVEHVREHAAAVEPLPPEQVVREAVGLRPGQLDGEEACRCRRRAGAAAGPARSRSSPAASRRVCGAPKRCRSSAGRRAAGGRATRRSACWCRARPTCRRSARSGRSAASASMPGEQLRVVLLEPREDLRGRLVEVQLRVAVHQADRRPERAPRLAARLGERPAPREVDVRVAGEQPARPPAGGARRPPRARRRGARLRAPTERARVVVEPGRRAGRARRAAPRRSAAPRCRRGGRRTAASRSASRARAARAAAASTSGPEASWPRAQRAAGLEHELEPAEQRARARRRSAPRARSPAGRRGWACRTAAARRLGARPRTACRRAGTRGARGPSRRTSLVAAGVASVTSASPPRSSRSRAGRGHSAGGATSGCSKRCTPVRSGHGGAERVRARRRASSPSRSSHVAVPPRAQLVDPDGEPVQPLGGGERRQGARLNQTRSSRSATIRRGRAPDEVAADLVGVGAERHPAAHQPALGRSRRGARRAAARAPARPRASPSTQARPGSISPTNG